MGSSYLFMDVLLIKKEFESEFHLNELLKEKFKIKIAANLISDVLFTKTTRKFIYLAEGYDGSFKKDHNTPTITVITKMTNQNLVKISMNCLEIGCKFMIFRDRFDLADLICTEIYHPTRPEILPKLTSDCVNLIALMTWESEPLELNDCKIVLEHFKSIENLFKVSGTALEFSLKSLQISDRSKQAIITFLTTKEDFYID